MARCHRTLFDERNQISGQERIMQCLHSVVDLLPSLTVVRDIHVVEYENKAVRLLRHRARFVEELFH